MHLFITTCIEKLHRPFNIWDFSGQLLEAQIKFGVGSDSSLHFRVRAENLGPFSTLFWIVPHLSLSGAPSLALTSSIFDVCWSRPWGVAWFLGLRGIPLRSYLSEV